MAPGPSVGDIPQLAKSFDRFLRAANRSPRTVQTYLEAVEQLERWKPATASNRFRALQQDFKYLEDEGEVRESPMRRMVPPQVAEQPVPILPGVDLRRLLADCARTGFEDRRDTAIIRLPPCCAGGANGRASPISILTASATLSPTPGCPPGARDASGGWRGRDMLSRCAASAADERAREAHRRLSLGDRL